jgi:predicted nucleic acid-binding protein
MTAAVVDANVWCDALLPGSLRTTARRTLRPYTTIIAPEQLRLEVANVIRRFARRDIDQVVAAKIIHTVSALDLVVVPTVDLLPRVWELRGSLSCYDAAYLAAAELHEVPLLTRDAALLAHADQARCPVVTVT